MEITKLWAWLVIMILLLLINGKWYCNGCLKEERIALLHLKDSIHLSKGEPRGLSQWVDNDTADCCQWPQVECSPATKRVIRLSLRYIADAAHPKENISDTELGYWYLNASLFLPFQELRVLHLARNNLAGFIENEGFDKLSMLKKLVELDLSDNLFDCNILSSLSWLASLERLYLEDIFRRSDSSSLSQWDEGSICDAGFGRLTGLKSLQELDISDNDNAFRGSDVLSVLDLNDFIHLKVLDISDNGFRSFGNTYGLRNLTRLHLNGNNFSNNIFFSLQGLSSLEYLDLSKNNIKDSVQVNELHVLTNLKELDLSYNQFQNFNTSGDILSRPSLQELHLDGMSNSYFGSILSSLSAFPYLKYLHLAYNNATINEGSELRNISQLEGLYIDRSHVDTNFLQGIGVMSSLKYLSLSKCGLNGTLHAQGLCDLKNLEELDLSYNEFDGRLPSCLGNITSLRFIDLSHNNFRGNIALFPLSKFTLLEYLSLSRNNFQIPISFQSFLNHSNLRFLFAKGNEIIAEVHERNWIPSFQLEVFSLSNCADNQMIPNFLWYQSELRILDLSHNNFGGSFPTWLLENNTMLEGAILSNNYFGGALKLPSTVNFQMEIFDISINNLNGQIPSNLSTVFPQLGLLNMSENFFDGAIPSSLGKLQALHFLDLSTNKLSGRAPQELFTGCLQLEVCKLSNNKIQGEILSGAIDLAFLIFLHLDCNELSGSIPSSLFALPLRVLDISNNHFSGQIPRSVGNGRQLLQAVMSRNQLEGHIPEEFCNLRRLDLLDLSQNHLSGLIPTCFNATRIAHIYLSNNHLEGQLTYAFYNCSNLVTLDLRANELSGSIPQWIPTLSDLSVIQLGDNHFEGTIPEQLCEITKLSVIDLSSNNLSGHIPHCLGNITLDVSEKSRTPDFYPVFDIRDNMRKTLHKMGYHVPHLNPEMTLLRSLSAKVQVPTVFRTKRNSLSYTGNILDQMSGIDLSSNNFNGEIPDELGYLMELRTLNLSHNNLTGTIPATFSNMRQLESLDLSYNHLGGSIPTQLSDINSLAVFSVAHNNLSGKIQQNGQFGTFEENDFEGNPFLCGKPLHVDCLDTGSTLGQPTHTCNVTEESNFIDKESFYTSFIVSYICAILAIFVVLFINPYWRKALFDFVELLVNYV